AEIADMPIMGAIVHLRVNDVFDLAIRLPTRVLLAETPLSSILDLSPPRWVDRPVWLRLRARTQVEPAPAGQRRFLRLDVERLYLGRTRLPAVAHRLLLSPLALKLLLCPAPPPPASARRNRRHQGRAATGRHPGRRVAST